MSQQVWEATVDKGSTFRAQGGSQMWRFGIKNVERKPESAGGVQQNALLIGRTLTSRYASALLGHDIITEPKWQLPPPPPPPFVSFGWNVQEVKNDPKSLEVLEASL